MRKFSRSSHTVGLPPGTLTPRPEPSEATVAIKLLSYDAATLEERDLERIEDCLERTDGDRVNWIDIDGVHDIAAIQALGERFDLHPLLLEDVVHTAQRSKVERYGANVYIVVRLLEFDPEREEIESTQLSLVLAGNTLITFQEAATGIFAGVLDRIRSGRPGIRTSGAAYLVYALLDAVVDHYFVLLERVGEHIENVEDALIAGPDGETLTSIHRLKRELIYLRKSVWPLREAIGSMLRDDELPFQDRLHVYLRDLHDHTVHVMETIESYRDLNAGMFETYLSMISNRMNEVMKTLTIIATLFIPLTFIVGVYGMNFDYMPELHQRWAYPAVWVVMVLVAMVMVRYFRRRGWA